jgi:Protein of unknown function (DUF2950)
MAIEVCGAAAAAEREYFNQSHDGETGRQYAQQIVSDPGKHNGLYWSAAQGQASSPLGDLGELAQALGYKNAGSTAHPFNGYYYRILTKQGDGAPGGAKDYIVNGKMTGGFAILAYPAEYGNSGIMTFVVGADGILYQKDLGDKTSELGSTMTEYNPGRWMDSGRGAPYEDGLSINKTFAASPSRRSLISFVQLLTEATPTSYSPRIPRGFHLGVGPALGVMPKAS